MNIIGKVVGQYVVTGKKGTGKKEAVTIVY
jgi:hypothetical protein